MTESYDQLRDQATGGGAEAWRQADREEGKLRGLYTSLKEDPRWSEEHKAENTWSTYWEVDHGLVWVHEREVWVHDDWHAYDGSRFGIGSRRPRAA
jgi:hypothetical protein